MITITVSGKTYLCALDPRATQVAGEIGLPKPTVHRIGKGYQYRYRVTREQALDLVEHLNTMGYCCVSGSDDPEGHAEGRACYADARKIEALVKATEVTS